MPGQLQQHPHNFVRLGYGFTRRLHQPKLPQPGSGPGAMCRARRGWRDRWL